MILAVPEAEGVNVTPQLATPRLTALTEQVVELKPGAPGAKDVLNVTVPVGVTAVPEAMSDTVAVQVDAWFTNTVPGEQLIAVVVVRRPRAVTVMMKEPELADWTVLAG